MTLFDRLLEAFSNIYGETEKYYKFSFRRGATIYVPKSDLNRAAMIVTCVQNGNFPNGDALIRYVERRNIPIHTRNVKADEYRFGPEHIDRVIAILNGE